MCLRLLGNKLNDWRLNSFFVDLLPVEYALKLVEFDVKEKTELYNAVSTTNAFGWAALMSSFGDNKLDWHDLLPINTQQKSTVKEGFRQPTDRTLDIIKRLIDQNRLSFAVQNSILATGCLM